MDFYAYDDGKPEGSLGVRTSYGKVAYQYALFEPDTLTALDIQFRQANENLVSVTIGLRIWKNLNPTIDDLIYAFNAPITFPQDGNTFFRYELDSGVLVEDTIYIGWIQFTDDLIHVGYDLNNNSTEKLFSKTQASGWRWESDFFPGSMLFRPVFENVPDDLPIATPPQFAQTNSSTQNKPYDVLIGPNPTRGTLNLYGEYDKIRIVDHHGRIVWEEIDMPKKQALDLSDLDDGFYLIYFENNSEFTTKRIYLQK